MWSFTRSFFESLRRPVFFYLMTLAFTLIAACSWGIFVLERGANEGIKSYFDALYYSITVMTGVGLGDIRALTGPGRLLSMVMMLLGTGIFVSFTAVLSVALLEAEIEHRRIGKMGPEDEL